MICHCFDRFFFFFNDPAPPEISTLSLPAPLPVSLVALDEQGQWYRYHRLFAEALRQWLQQTAPALVPALHLRASRWYEQHGLIAKAVSHTLAARSEEHTSELQSPCNLVCRLLLEK